MSSLSWLEPNFTHEERQEELQLLTMHIDRALDLIEEDSNAWLPVYKALQALESQLGKTATQIRYERY